MDNKTKIIVNKLLAGNYIVRRYNDRKAKKYVLCSNGNPIEYVSESQYRFFKNVLKEDKKLRRCTLNLSLVRQMHGKCFIKQQYKKNQIKNYV